MPEATLPAFLVPAPVIGSDRALLPPGLVWRRTWWTLLPLEPRGEERARACVADASMGPSKRMGGPKGRRRALSELAGEHRAGPPRAAAQVHMYTPEATRVWQAQATMVLRAAWHAAGHAQPVGERTPVRVEVVALFRRPARPMHSFFVAVKPDRDNLDKIVLDAMVKADVLHDDQRVVAGEPVKIYAPEGHAPGVIIAIYELAMAASEEASCRC